MDKSDNNTKKQAVGERSITIINEESLRDKIYLIRGQRVMLGYDLAGIYGYTTSALNRQVKNNSEKFSEEEFMFQLSRGEADYFLRCKNYILENNYTPHFKYLPYAFTEQGIYMLMTVLRGKLATEQSKTLIRLNVLRYLLSY